MDKPTNRQELIHFLVEHFKFLGKFEEDRFTEFEIIESDISFRVIAWFTYEIDGDGEHKRTDDFFTWLKSESVETLEKYLTDMHKLINEQPITIKKQKHE